MQLIKLSATDSTNTYLKRMSAHGNVPDFTVVQAQHQTAGRGQRGNSWQAEGYKNLTFSVLKKHKALDAGQHFLLNMAVSLSIYRSLDALGIPGLRVKWPNDILSGGRKIGGILIENQFRGDKISQSIIGIGLNVNQTELPDLPSASSLRRVCGRLFDLDELLLALTGDLQIYLDDLSQPKFQDLHKAYETHLYLKDVPADYSREDGSRFRGIIRGVLPDGRLEMEVEEGLVEAFEFRQVRFHLPA